MQHPNYAEERPRLITPEPFSGLAKSYSQEALSQQLGRSDGRKNKARVGMERCASGMLMGSSGSATGGPRSSSPFLPESSLKRVPSFGSSNSSFRRTGDLSYSESAFSRTHGTLLFGSKRSMTTTYVNPNLALSQDSQKVKALDSSGMEIFTPTQAFQMERWNNQHIQGEDLHNITEHTEDVESSKLFPKVHAPSMELSQLLQSGATPKPRGPGPATAGNDVSLTFTPSPCTAHLPRLEEPSSSNENPLSMISPNPGSYRGGLPSFLDLHSTPPDHQESALGLFDPASMKNALALAKIEITRLTSLLDKKSKQLVCEKEVVFKMRQEKLAMARQFENFQEQVALTDQKHLDSSKLPVLRGQMLNEVRARLQDSELRELALEQEIGRIQDGYTEALVDKESRNKEIADLCMDLTHNRRVIQQLQVQLEQQQQGQAEGPQEEQLKQLLVSYEEQVKRRNQEIEDLKERNEALEEELSRVEEMHHHGAGLEQENQKLLRSLEEATEGLHVLKEVCETFAIEVTTLAEFKEWLAGVQASLAEAREAQEELERVKECMLSPLSGKQRLPMLTSPSHLAQDLLLQRDREIRDLSEEFQEFMKKISQAVGLQEGASIEECLGKIEELKKQERASGQRASRLVGQVRQARARSQEIIKMEGEDAAAAKRKPDSEKLKKLEKALEEEKLKFRAVSSRLKGAEERLESQSLIIEEMEAQRQQEVFIAEEGLSLKQEESKAESSSVEGDEAKKRIALFLEDIGGGRAEGTDQVDCLLQRVRVVYESKLESAREESRVEREDQSEMKEIQASFELRVGQIKEQTASELQMIMSHMQEEEEQRKQELERMQLTFTAREQEYQLAQQRVTQEFEERKKMWEEETRLQKDQLTKRGELQVVRLKTQHSGELSELEQKWQKQQEEWLRKQKELEEAVKVAKMGAEREMRGKAKELGEENSRLRRELEDSRLLTESLRKESGGRAEEEREKAKKERAGLIEKHRAEMRNAKEDHKNEMIRKKGEAENELKRARREIESRLRQEIQEESRAEGEEEQRRYKKELEKKLSARLNIMKAKAEREWREREEAARQDTERDLRAKFREERERAEREHAEDLRDRLQAERERLVKEARSQIEASHRKEMSELEARLRKRANLKEAKVTQEMSERISELEAKAKRKAIAVRDALCQTAGGAEEQEDGASPEMRLKRAFISSMSHIPLQTLPIQTLQSEGGAQDSLRRFTDAVQLELDKILFTINDNFKLSENGLSAMFLGSVNEKIGELVGDLGAEGLVAEIRERVGIILKRVLDVCEKEKNEKRALQETFASSGNRISHSHSMSTLPQYEPSVKLLHNQSDELIPLSGVVKDLSLLLETMSAQFPELGASVLEKENREMDDYRVLLNCILRSLAKLKRKSEQRAQEVSRFRLELTQGHGLNQGLAVGLLKQLYPEEPVAQFLSLVKETRVLIAGRQEVVRQMEGKVVESAYNPEVLRREIQGWMVEDLRRKLGGERGAELSPEMLSPQETVQFVKATLSEMSEESCLVQEYLRSSSFQDAFRSFIAHCEALLAPRMSPSLRIESNPSYLGNSRNLHSHGVLHSAAAAAAAAGAGYHTTRAGDGTPYLSHSSSTSSFFQSSSSKRTPPPRVDHLPLRSAERYQEDTGSSVNQRIQDLFLNSSMMINDYSSRTPMTARYSGRTDALNYSLTPSVLNTPNHHHHSHHRGPPKSARLLQQDEGLSSALFKH